VRKKADFFHKYLCHLVVRGPVSRAK